MKSFYIATALVASVLAKNCEQCSTKRKHQWDKVGQDFTRLDDCIKWANDQDDDFYQNEFLEYSYAACNDPEEILASVHGEESAVQCIPLDTPTQNEPLLKDQECKAGEYLHYHWTIQDYEVINDNAGSSIEFILTPCDGQPEIFIKPQILYAGIPMCQLFETNSTKEVGSQGAKTKTWPFPDKHTGTGDQGPDWELFMLEKKAKAKAQNTKCEKNGRDECSNIPLQYPGQFFSQQKWGHNGTQATADGRPQPQHITIPSISYGGFFISVYCHTDNTKFEIGIKAKTQKEATALRHQNRDDDSLASKVRRWQFDVDDKKMDDNWDNYLAWARGNCSGVDDETTCHTCIAAAQNTHKDALTYYYCNGWRGIDYRKPGSNTITDEYKTCASELAETSLIKDRTCDDDYFQKESDTTHGKTPLPRMVGCIRALFNDVYTSQFGMSKFKDGHTQGAHHPEASPVTTPDETKVEIIETAEGDFCPSQPNECTEHADCLCETGTKLTFDKTDTRDKCYACDASVKADPCHSFRSAFECAQNCCSWSPLGDGDIADFVAHGPFGTISKQVLADRALCRPAATTQSLCVTKKKQSHMQEDNKVCASDGARDEGDCERIIQATMEVAFYTGDQVGLDAKNEEILTDVSQWPLFQLQAVEMNDCYSQLDKIGQNYCWKAPHDRVITEFGQDVIQPAGKQGYRYAHSCGYGSGSQGNPSCSVSHQSPGKCFWNGGICNNENCRKMNLTTKESQWSANSKDCIMWTPCGVEKNGKPVWLEHEKGKAGSARTPDFQIGDLISREIPAENKNGQRFDVKGSVYLYGHLSTITMESVESTSRNIQHSRYVLKDDQTWLRLKPRTWVRVEIPVHNNVTYFFNVVRKFDHPDMMKIHNGTHAYNGVSAVTTFYHQTQLYSDTTILIIAAVVVAALFALLIPFIFTKRKIKEHLRQVYEQHKQRGQARAKEITSEAKEQESLKVKAPSEAPKTKLLEESQKEEQVLKVEGN